MQLAAECLKVSSRLQQTTEAYKKLLKLAVSRSQEEATSYKAQDLNGPYAQRKSIARRKGLEVVGTQ